MKTILILVIVFNAKAATHINQEFDTVDKCATAMRILNEQVKHMNQYTSVIGGCFTK